MMCSSSFASNHTPVAPTWRLRPSRSVGILILLAALALYLWTLDDGLQPEELRGGDLITHQYAQVQARPANAPGYPLYTMGGWLWFRLGRALFGLYSNPIAILSSYSTLWALLALGLLYRLLLDVAAGDWAIAGLGTAFYAVTYFFWYYATTTEQYTSAVAVFLERFTGIIFLLILAVISPFFTPKVLGYIRVIIPMLGSLMLLAFMMPLLKTDRLLQIMNIIILKIISIIRAIFHKIGIKFLISLVEKAVVLYGKIFDKGMKFYRKLMKAIGLFKHHPGYLFATIFLTVLFYAETWLNVFFAFRTFNVHDLGFLQIVSLLPIIMLVSMIPITFGSIGLAEGAYVFYFALVGIKLNEAWTMSLLLRFKLMLMAATGFILYLTNKERKKDYREMVQIKAHENGAR